MSSAVIPDVRYARSGDVSIAYQLLGEGRGDIAFVRGFAGNLLDDDTHAITMRETKSLVESLDGEPATDRVLATVVFTDIVGSSERAAELGDRRWRELLDAHHATVRSQLARFHGEEIDTAGDGFFAAIDGPARAINAACSIRDAVSDLSLKLRIGVHTGECELRGGRPTGIAVRTGARIASAAGAGEVLVSSTVKDLVAGSGIEFADRGEEELKGVGSWHLYSVVDA